MSAGEGAHQTVLQMLKGSMGTDADDDNDEDEDEDEERNLHLPDVCPERQIFGRKETGDTSASLFVHLIRSTNSKHR